MTTHRPVTGPDGDNPISDDQIRELLFDQLVTVGVANDCRCALGWVRILNDDEGAARERCAAAYNALTVRR